MHWSDRMHRRLGELGWSLADLSRESGVDYDKLAKWAQGSVDNPRGDGINRVASAMGVTDAWLRFGQPPKYLANVNVMNLGPAAPDNPNLTTVPVIDLIAAGKLSEIADPYEVGDGEEFQLTDTDIGPRAFALRVEGESMLPRFRPGTIIVCDPDASIKPGDFVIAKNATEAAATFKKYRPRGVDETGHEMFELLPLNEDYETFVSNSKTPFALIGKVVRHIESL